MTILEDFRRSESTEIDNDVPTISAFRREEDTDMGILMDFRRSPNVDSDLKTLEDFRREE